MDRFLALDDFAAAARRRLPRMLHGFVAGAAETDQSLRDNRAAFAEWGFVPRENIQGKAWIIYWSWESLTDIRWGRIGTFLYPDASITSQ